jgi:hypothetical protein
VATSGPAADLVSKWVEKPMGLRLPVLIPFEAVSQSSLKS